MNTLLYSCYSDQSENCMKQKLWLYREGREKPYHSVYPVRTNWERTKTSHCGIKVIRRAHSSPFPLLPIFPTGKILQTSQALSPVSGEASWSAHDYNTLGEESPLYLTFVWSKMLLYSIMLKLRCRPSSPHTPHIWGHFPSQVECSLSLPSGNKLYMKHSSSPSSWSCTPPSAT